MPAFRVDDIMWNVALFSAAKASRSIAAKWQDNVNGEIEATLINYLLDCAMVA
ncbi:hypothetical protein CY34DRAFT_804992 [Suillus luteus UH-Slu-Lm8-n1]|uniref:Uncharacterized protein n=1 Tax=Suillus luteus UH-Slu-Lm8-n1 TaxID=930992 RepID=A0A0C9ZXB2_9AGAM|nr:hypothetical protein CY34DRAFT_804992 [Suillus luteus UH-Slu-Lm8-n1]